MSSTQHGGPDAAGVPRWDFSTNANACGPAPRVLLSIRQADAARYPDPSYTALREQLASFHAVPSDRIVIAATMLGQGTHEFSYLVRATRPGLFLAGPTRAEEMYSPEIFGRGPTIPINVRP